VGEHSKARTRREETQFGANWRNWRKGASRIDFGPDSFPSKSNNETDRNVNLDSSLYRFEAKERERERDR